jgi:IclR family KDG regulon transcriptional repressor
MDFNMSVQSLDRAFDILELLSKERRGMMLTDIGKSLDLHKSTVYRLLSSLKERGYIEKDRETGNYRLGLGFIALTSQYLNNLEIKTEAEPYLRRLSDRLGETVFLAVLRDDEVVYIDKVERFDGLRRYSIIGQRRPIYCTSLGKSLVMERDPRELREILTKKPLKKFTNKTIIDADVFLKQLEIIRDRGWSNDDEEYDLGVSCVGAPIRDYRGNIIAAISSAWEGIKGPEDVKERGEQLKSIADEISRHLGFFPRGSSH